MIECIQVTTADVVLKIIYQTETIKNFRYLWLHLYLYNIEHIQTEVCTALLYCYTLVFRDDIWTVVQLKLNLVFLVVEQLQLRRGRVPGSGYFAADHCYHPYYYQNQQQRNQEKSHNYGDYSEMSLVKLSWIPTLWLLLSVTSPQWMLGLEFRHGGQLFLPRPGGEGLQGERFGAKARHGGVDTDQEVTGGGKICHRQPRRGAGDVVEEGRPVCGPHFKLIGLRVLGSPGPH